MTALFFETTAGFELYKINQGLPTYYLTKNQSWRIKVLEYKYENYRNRIDKFLGIDKSNCEEKLWKYKDIRKD